jgi:hypothetical protein
MGLKLGTRSPKLKGVSAAKGGMTPKVGRTWKSSAPSLGWSQPWLLLRDSGKRRKILQDVVEVCSFSADAEVVEHRIAVGVIELGTL